MKKTLLYLLPLIFIGSGLIAPTDVLAAAKTVKKTPAVTAADLPGRLTLQTDSDNKLWYVTPITKQRWYLHNDADLETLVYYLNTKPTANDFTKLAKNSKAKTPKNLLKKYAGKILLSPIDKKTVFYLNPSDGLIYEIKDFAGFYKIAGIIGKKAAGEILRRLAMNTIQDTYDPAFYGTASVKYDGVNFFAEKNSDVVLPLASLTKLMTALVFLDTKPNWDKEITITNEEIGYPCTLQLCGTTSEIDLKTGDRVKTIDLWVAMLSASSNQAAVILADNSGLIREEFIAQMNAKATSTLGLVKTKFVEMSGLSPDNVSTAKEFAKVAALAFADYRISEATKNTDYAFTANQVDGTTREVKVLNRNYSLLAISAGGSSKSGYLIEAQRNAVVEKDGQIAVALHCYSLKQRNSIIDELLNGDALALAN